MGTVHHQRQHLRNPQAAVVDQQTERPQLLRTYSQMGYLITKLNGRKKPHKNPDLLWARTLAHNIAQISNEKERKLLKLDIWKTW